MKRKLWYVSLALALVLTTFMPISALAAKPVPFDASGTITYISPGTVFPAGKSDRWVVVERELVGEFLSGDISGEFTMTYKANVESMQTQAGNFHGTLTVSERSYVLNVNGKSESLEVLQWMEYPPGSGNWVPVLMKLAINGHWTFTDGARGQGSFDGWAIFIPTPEGHVGTIVVSSFTMTGK